jgi:hypothetical protein
MIPPLQTKFATIPLLLFFFFILFARPTKKCGKEFDKITIMSETFIARSKKGGTD